MTQDYLSGQRRGWRLEVGHLLHHELDREEDVVGNEARAEQDHKPRRNESFEDSPRDVFRGQLFRGQWGKRRAVCGPAVAVEVAQAARLLVPAGVRGLLASLFFLALRHATSSPLARA